MCPPQASEISRSLLQSSPCSNLLNDIVTQPVGFSKNMLKKTAMVALVLASSHSRRRPRNNNSQHNLQTPVNVQTSMTASGCDNSPGPQITLQGAMTIGGIGVHSCSKTTRRNPPFTVESTDSNCDSAGQSVTNTQTPVLAETGGILHINQFVDNQQQPSLQRSSSDAASKDSSTHLLTFPFQQPLSAQVSAGSCNKPRFDHSLSGQMSLTGNQCNIIFSNNDKPSRGTPPEYTATAVSVVLIPAGQTIQFAKQPHSREPRKPMDIPNILGRTRPASQRSKLLGRCVQL